MKDRGLNGFLLSLICITVICMVYLYAFIIKPNGDNIEHLHTSWLIWQGHLPYKDFFQHHNPLLWYIFAPLVGLMIDSYSIFSLFNTISILVVFLTLWYQAKIIWLEDINKTSGLMLIAMGISSSSIMWTLNYRPDTFMYLFFFMGTYYFLRHIKEQKTHLLAISYLSFFISFMFTQKVLLNLIIIGIASIYFLLKKKITYKNFGISCILPSVLMLSYVIYLYSHDSLTIYWISNYQFNTGIPDIFGKNRIAFPPIEYFEFYIFIPLGAISTLYLLFKGTQNERLISILFIEESILRIFYFSAFLHYVSLWLLLGMMVTIMFCRYISCKKILATLGILYLIFSYFYNYERTYKIEIQNQKYTYGYEYAFYNLTPCDYALNGYYAVYNLKGKDLGYYSILLGQIDILGEKTGIAPRDNLNKLTVEKKPKLIFGGTYWDTYWEQRGIKYPAHKIDKNIIEKYYQPTSLKDIYILKQEYRKHNCEYNGKSWEYTD